MEQKCMHRRKELLKLCYKKAYMTFDIMLNKKCSKLTFMLSVFQIPSKYQPRNRGILLLYSRVEKRGLKQEERERRKKSA